MIDEKKLKCERCKVELPHNGYLMGTPGENYVFCEDCHKTLIDKCDSVIDFESELKRGPENES